MILDCSKYVGPCKCGREHTLETKKVVVEYDALDKFDQYMDEVGLTGKRAVIYDTNTYNLPTLKHVRADQEIVLNAEGLHSEKGMIEDMMRQLDHPDVIVAVGSGTIMTSAATRRTSSASRSSPCRRLRAPTALRPTSARSSSMVRKSPSPCRLRRSSSAT